MVATYHPLLLSGWLNIFWYLVKGEDELGAEGGGRLIKVRWGIMLGWEELNLSIMKIYKGCFLENVFNFVDRFYWKADFYSWISYIVKIFEKYTTKEANLLE